jgi:hypothetical protein
MAYQKGVLEQFAMQAEHLSQQATTFGASVGVDAIADAMGIPRQDGYALARYLHDLEWAVVSFSGDARLTLTPKGYEEIAKLRRPRWRRWIDENPVTMNVIWMTLTAIVAGIVYTTITYYLLK